MIDLSGTVVQNITFNEVMISCQGQEPVKTIYHNDEEERRRRVTLTKAVALFLPLG